MHKDSDWTWNIRWLDLASFVSDAKRNDRMLEEELLLRHQAAELPAVFALSIDQADVCWVSISE